MRKLILVAVLAVIAVAPCFAQANPAQTVPFDHWAYDAVNQLVERGIIIGYPDGTFKGDRAMTRYEFAMAISRLLDVVQQGKGEKGDTGAAGAPGAKGDKGDKGDPGVVDEAKIAALVNKLCDEFKNELKDLRGDLDLLGDDVAELGERVTYLEEQAKGPKVFGWLDYRIGTVGDKVDFDNEFDNLTAMVGVQGKISDSVSGRIAIKMRDTDDLWLGGYDGDYYAEQTGSFDTSMPAVDGNYAESLWIDEANVVVNSKFVLPATWTIGRQFQSYGMGLLVDNERKSQQGVRMQVNDIFGSNFDLDIFGGGSDGVFTPMAIGDYSFNVDENFNRLFGDNDGYASARLAYARPTWNVGFNWLQDGVGREQGWSADLSAQIWGRDVRAEYADMRKGMFGGEGPDNGKAFMGSADIWRGTDWRLTGFYSSVDADYDMVYSILHPYFEFRGADERAIVATANAYGVSALAFEQWLRNPLAIANHRVIGGHLDFRLGSMPFTVAYFDVNAKVNPVFYDKLWAIGTSKQLADGITANLVYAQQNVSSEIEDAADAIGVSRPEDQKLLQASVTVGF